MRHSVLGFNFFVRPTLQVTRDLLGKYLIHNRGGDSQARMITEVEAYDGPEDRACHASKGRTARTSVMFEPGGVWYVYFIYGMYDMLNIVVGDEGYPAAALIRGVEGISGPGRLTKALGIDRFYNTKPATRKSGLYIEDRGIEIREESIITTPRIGVQYAGPDWSERHYRFCLR